MGQRATVYDVAGRAGVSIATVSFAFRQPDRVKLRTREAVYRAANELGYAPSASARQLAHGAERALGLYSFDMVLPSELDAASTDFDELVNLELASDVQFRRFPLYVDEIQHGFQLESMRRGRNVLIGAGASHDAIGTMDIAGSVEGLAMFPGAVTPELIARVAERMPVVVFSRPSEPGIYEVRIDNKAAMGSLVDHLVDEHNFRDLVFVGGLDAPDIVERFEAFQTALSNHGIAVPDAPFDTTSLTGSRLLSLRRAISEESPPRVLVCATDQLALTVLDLLAAHHIRVPEDVVVTGFDGIAASGTSVPPLTTVRQPFVAMGQLAVRILVGDPEATATRSHLLPTRLVTRASCGC